MAVFVFANGDIDEPDWIRPYLDQAGTIIAANGGTRHLMALDRAPDIVIGDLDSLPLAARSWLASTAVRFVPHPSAKDETDLELALVYAVTHYGDEIWLFGTLGGRLDQTLANILLLAHPALRDRQVQLVNRHERAWLVTTGSEIRGAVGDLVSLIPLGGDVVIEETTGLHWPLRNERLVFGLARGTSNVMTADRAAISLQSGRLLCIHTRGSWQR
jgi:thiamine pyrophosphokinase